MSNGPVQTQAACRNRVPNRIVIDALSWPVTLRQIDSDLLLTGGSSPLRFRLVEPRFPSLATTESLAGTWSGASLNDEPIGLLHVLQFGAQGSPDPSTNPASGGCAGMLFENFGITPAGLLHVDEPRPLPGCPGANNSKLLRLMQSNPRVEIYEPSVLLVRSPSSVATFSTAVLGAGVPPESVPAPRPAVPATDTSAAGRWTVESINGIAAPTGLWLEFPKVRGFDGCNTFTALPSTQPTKRVKRGAKQKAKKTSAKRTFGADGSIRVASFVSTYQACSEVGFTWDQRLAKVFRELPIGEHVGDGLVIRSPSNGFQSGFWITLRRASN